jgi:hypothetical protein
MQIIFMEDENENDDSRIILTVESDKHLKNWIKYYAYKQGVPLQLLHFFHAGKTLLLSRAGHISPKAFDM